MAQFPLLHPEGCTHDAPYRRLAERTHDGDVWIVCLVCGAMAQAGLPRGPPSAGTSSTMPPAPPVLPAFPGAAGAPEASVTDRGREPTAPEPPAATPDEPVVPTSTVRALADIPPFIDQGGQLLHLKVGDVATVSRGIATLLVKRQKAQLVEVTA